MPVGFLERKKRAIEEVIAAYAAFQRALGELPPEWAREILAELTSGSQVEQKPDETAPPESAPDDSGDDLPTATEAVRDLLQQHPSGMYPNQIIKTLDGKFRTTSANPSKLLYSTLALLKRTGKVEQTADNRYRLLEATKEQMVKPSEEDDEPPAG